MTESHVIALARRDERQQIARAIEAAKVEWTPYNTLIWEGLTLEMTRMEADLFNAALDIAAQIAREGR